MKETITWSLLLLLLVLQGFTNYKLVKTQQLTIAAFYAISAGFTMDDLKSLAGKKERSQWYDSEGSVNKDTFRSGAKFSHAS